jgi:hypothetical protein
MISKSLLTFVCILMCLSTYSQPPLSKRLQKEKEAFETLIANEEKYEALVNQADEAFQAKDYVKARMSYAEAIPFNAEMEQWLIAKVNDLDILMAKNAAREVDSIKVVAGLDLSIALPEAATNETMKPRSMEAPLPLPERVDSHEVVTVAEQIPETAEIKGENQITAVTKKEPVTQVSMPVVPAPKAVETVKVKEDFSGFQDGITEETIDLPNHSVLRVVVKEGMDVKVFKRVKHKWGGQFYFLDDVGTTERYWSDQVEKYREKYRDTGN